MCESSRDILNLTLAASVAILTFLLAWLLSYAIIATRSALDVIRRVREVMTNAEHTLTALKEKIKEAGIVLPLVMKAVEKLVTYIGEKKRSRQNNSNTKT